MANYANLLATIAANIYTNGNQEVTAAMVKTGMNAAVASLGAGYQFMCVAHPSDTPSGYSDLRAFWLAGEAGTYTNFGGLVVNEGEVAVIKYDGNGFSKEVTGAATAVQVYEKTDGINVLIGKQDDYDFDISSYEGFPYFINSSGLWAEAQNADTFTKLIPVGPGTYKLKASVTTQSIYAILSSDVINVGSPAPFAVVNGAQLTSRVLLAADTEEIITIDDESTARFLAVRADISGALPPAYYRMVAGLKFATNRKVTNLGHYTISGITTRTYSWLADVYLTPGMIVKNTGSIPLNLYAQKNTSASYVRLNVGAERTLSNLIVAVRSGDLTGDWSIEARGDIGILQKEVEQLYAYKNEEQDKEVVKNGRIVSGTIASTYTYGQPFGKIQAGSLIRNNGDINLNCYNEVDGSYFSFDKGKIIITRQDISVVRSKETAGNYSIEVYGTNRIIPKNCYQFIGDIAANTEQELGQNSVKTFKRFSLSAKVSNFDKIIISHGASSAWDSSWVEIDGTNVKVSTHTSSTTLTTEAHGLTISGDIQITLQFDTEQVLLTLQSQGQRFEQSFDWSGANQIISIKTGTTTSLQDCTASWTCKGLTSPIWLFGDSYLSYTSVDRWPYYLFEDKHTNFLLNGYPGEQTATGRNDLQNLLIAGKPNYIVWCMGMNDSDDPNSGVVNYNWKQAYDSITAFCDLYGITLILATIPNTPARNHTYKNAIVKASGHRFIDFAKAVGAETAGSSWYAGMLSSDEVHPTALGAKALYIQAVADFPEFLNT